MSRGSFVSRPADFGQPADAQVDQFATWSMSERLSWPADPGYTDVMSETATLDTESEILEQVIEPDTAGMSPEAAQRCSDFDSILPLSHA